MFDWIVEGGWDCEVFDRRYFGNLKAMVMGMGCTWPRPYISKPCL